MLLRGPSEMVFISPFVEEKRLQCLASVMPASVIPSVQQLNKRKDLPVSFQTPRLQQNFQAATQKQWR